MPGPGRREWRVGRGERGVSERSLLCPAGLDQDVSVGFAAASTVAVWALRAVLGYRNVIVRYELLLNQAPIPS